MKNHQKFSTGKWGEFPNVIIFLICYNNNLIIYLISHTLIVTFYLTIWIFFLTVFIWHFSFFLEFWNINPEFQENKSELWDVNLEFWLSQVSIKQIVMIVLYKSFKMTYNFIIGCVCVYACMLHLIWLIKRK